MAIDYLLRLILVGIFMKYSKVSEAGGSCSRLENKILDKLLDMIVDLKSGSTKQDSNNRPAFTVTLKTNLMTLSGIVIAKFDNIILNRGDGYDPKTGKFTAPKSGLYQFSFTIMSCNGGSLHISVVKNRKTIIAMYCSKIHGATETANPVLELKEGDAVYLMHVDSLTQQMLGMNYSYMSGYYIGECL